MYEHFSHETPSYSSTLAKNSGMWSGKEADLLYCLKSTVAASGIMPEVIIVVLDGAVIVNMIIPTPEKTSRTMQINLVRTKKV